MRFFYSLVTLLFMPMAFGHLLQRGRRQPEYRRHWGERLGFAPRLDGPVLWLHAVSVGETRAAAPLIEALLQRHPGHRLLLTHTTPTGRATGHALFGHYGERVVQAYLPYDLPGAVARFLRRTLPEMGILMETEIWPNLYAAAAGRGTRLFLVNARMSAKSAGGYARLGRLTRVTLQHLTAIAAQTEADAARLAELGAEHITVCGNLKFDVDPPANTAARAAELRALFGNRQAWVAASTREAEGDSEEAMIVDAWLERSEKSGSDLDFSGGEAEAAAGNRVTKNRGKTSISPHCLLDSGLRRNDGTEKLGSDPNYSSDSAHPLLVIVPRHPQRFDAVAAMLAARGVRFVRRSEGHAAGADTQIVLGDSMGEMAAYYAAADLAFIGGSLLPLGGQNLIEAAAAGCPVLIGPHSFNFEAATEAALAAGAAVRVTDADALAEEVTALLAEPARLDAMRDSGRAFAAQHRGATARILAVLETTLRKC